MCLEVPPTLFGACRIERPLRFGPAVNEPVRDGAFLLGVSLRLLAGFPQIDKVTHRGAVGTKILWGNCDGSVVIEQTIPATPPDSED